MYLVLSVIGSLYLTCPTEQKHFQFYLKIHTRLARELDALLYINYQLDALIIIYS